MKIIKIKASDFYEKKTKTNIDILFYLKLVKWTRKDFDYYTCYIAQKLFESACIYTHALLKSKQWISIFKKPNI